MRFAVTGLFLLSMGQVWGVSGMEFSFLQTAKTTKTKGPPPVNQVLRGVVGVPGRPPAPIGTGSNAIRTPPGGQKTKPPAAPGQVAPGKGKLPAGTGTGAIEKKDQPAAASKASSQVKNASSEHGVSFSFTNAPIESVVSAIMKELGYSYVIDPGVSGTVNIYTQGEIPRERLFQILEQLLNMNGQAIVRQEGIYVILPLGGSPRIPGHILVRPRVTAPAQDRKPAQSGKSTQEPQPASAPSRKGTAGGKSSQKKSTPPASRESSTASPPSPSQQPAAESGPILLSAQQSAETSQLKQEQGVITYIIPLHYIPSSDMVTMIKAFVSQGATVIDFQSANVLIITDFRANIQQVLNLIQLLDTQYFDLNTVDLVPVHYNQAEDVAEDLGKIFAPGDKAGGVRIVAIERLNSILIVTHAPSVLARVKGWIDKLDAPATGSNVKTFVYQVENNTAANIAEVLAQLYENGLGLPSGQSETQEGQTQPRAPRQQRPREAGFLPQREGALPLSSLGPALSGRSADSGIRAVVSGNVKIIVNEFNNSLIIQATQADYGFLLQTIKQLDVLPRQVLIEAQIYSVELNDALSFGVSAFLREKTADRGPATTASISAPGDGSTGGVLAASTIISIGSGRELLFALNALRTETNIEILEAPSLLVMDGTQAQINVGAEVPVTTASFTDPLRSGTGTGFANRIQFRPTGTTLLLLPRISASGIVTMDLAIEVSSASSPDTLTPTISRSFVQTSLITRDKQTIAIAGVISETDNISKSRVPVLGSIPIIGALFGQTSKAKRRKELVFFITPHVIRNLPTAVELTLEFKRALRHAYGYIEFQEKERRDLIQRRREQEMRQQRESDKPPDGN